MDEFSISVVRDWTKVAHKLRFALPGVTWSDNHSQHDEHIESRSGKARMKFVSYHAASIEVIAYISIHNEEGWVLASLYEVYNYISLQHYFHTNLFACCSKRLMFKGALGD